jgi:hypothetical protein
MQHFSFSCWKNEEALPFFLMMQKRGFVPSKAAYGKLSLELLIFVH